MIMLCIIYYYNNRCNNNALSSISILYVLLCIPVLKIKLITYIEGWGGRMYYSCILSIIRHEKSVNSVWAGSQLEQPKQGAEQSGHSQARAGMTAAAEPAHSHWVTIIL